MMMRWLRHFWEDIDPGRPLRDMRVDRDRLMRDAEAATIRCRIMETALLHISKLPQTPFGAATAVGLALQALHDAGVRARHVSER